MTYLYTKRTFAFSRQEARTRTRTLGAAHGRSRYQAGTDTRNRGATPVRRGCKRSSMDRTPLHDWLEPRVKALLDEAQAAGFARDAAEAVLIDLVTDAE